MTSARMAHFSIVIRGAATSNFPRRSIASSDVTNGEWRVCQFSPAARGLFGRLVDMLDQVEKRIELLREHATSMEQERDCLLSMLQAIMTNKDLQSVTDNEREEIEVTAQRLLSRTLTVEVAVTTPRNDLQQKALNRVNEFINVLVQKIQMDLESAREACTLYLNSCLADTRGPIDQRFQSVIIECTADDQKKTRKRLESLLTTIIHAEGTLHKPT